jgi:hypothetical protein
MPTLLGADGSGMTNVEHHPGRSDDARIPALDRWVDNSEYVAWLLDGLAD